MPERGAMGSHTAKGLKPLPQGWAVIYDPAGQPKEVYDPVLKARHSIAGWQVPPRLHPMVVPVVSSSPRAGRQDRRVGASVILQEGPAPPLKSTKYKPPLEVDLPRKPKPGAARAAKKAARPWYPGSHRRKGAPKATEGYRAGLYTNGDQLDQIEKGLLAGGTIKGVARAVGCSFYKVRRLLRQMKAAGAFAPDLT